MAFESKAAGTTPIQRHAGVASASFHNEIATFNHAGATVTQIPRSLNKASMHISISMKRFTSISPESLYGKAKIRARSGTQFTRRLAKRFSTVPIGVWSNQRLGARDTALKASANTVLAAFRPHTGL